MKNQGNLTSPKDHNNLPVIDPKDMEICNLPNKEIKIAVLKKLTELQEKKERHFNEIRKTIHGQNENFNKEIEIIFKNLESLDK